jgi:hypothetical protein
MSVSARSRYARLAPMQAPDADGVTRTALPIRRHEGVPASSARYAHLVTGAESLEYLAWRYQGSSEAWWRLADANPLRFPLEWRPGDKLDIASGTGAPGLVERDRRF